MSGEILVTFGEISNAQSSVAATSRNMNQELDDLKSFLAPLVATWTGQAAEDYQVKQREWDDAAAQLNQVLGQVGVALGTANDNYQQAERSNAAKWV